MLAASVREVVGKKEKVVLERSARLELDPKIRVRRNNLKETWVTGEKEEKKKKEKEEKKFMHADRRAGGPIKGSTRGPRGPKNLEYSGFGLDH